MKSTQTIVVSFAVGAILVAVVVAASFRTFNRINEAADARKQSYSIIIRADALLSELIDADTGQRGYLLTGDAALLEPYLKVRDSISRHLDALRQQTRIIASQEQLRTLTKLINAKMEYLSSSIELCRNHDMVAALSEVRSGQDRPLMDSIRAVMSAFNQQQESALVQRESALHASMFRLFVIIIAYGIIMLLFLFFFIYLIYRETRQQIRNSVHLETQRLLKLQETTNEELERVNTALHISEEKIAVTLNSIGDGVITTDTWALVTFVNPVAEKLTGWTPAEATGRPIDDIFRIINEETREPSLIPVKDTLAHGTIHGLANHTILIARNGNEYAIADSCAPIRTREGLIVGTVLVFRDVSERRKTESDLQDTRNELERIIKLQKQVITETKESLTTETKDRLFAESEHSHRQEALEAVYAMETAFDFNIESLYDRIVSSISATLRVPSVAIYEYRDGKIARSSRWLDNQALHEVPHSMPCASCQAVLDNKTSRQFNGNLENQFSGKLCFDSSRFHSWAGVPITGSQNEVFGLIKVLDSTSRVFTDLEINFIETFARYIANELSRRDLEYRLRRGEEMRLLGQLTSGVAHEVRNPLNGILSIMGVLTKELSDSERFLPYLQHMRNQVTRLTVLMEDLLVLGRPIREEDINEISMVMLVENALQTWLQTLQSPKPVVRLVKPELPERCMIRADDTYITQIIINLLDNARNHSLPGTEIVCSVCRHFFNTVRFCVTDRGTGIVEKNLSKIFDPFFTTRKGGTGLGLSIVKNIVESHKGSVSAGNTTDGPGATFEVVLPLYTGESGVG